MELPAGGRIALRIRSHKLGYEFWAGSEGGSLQKIGGGRSQLLSTETMAGTFTGCFFGLFCQGAEGAQARFAGFSCKY